MIMREDISPLDFARLATWEVLNMFKGNFSYMRLEGGATVRVLKLYKRGATIIELTDHKDRSFSRYIVTKDSNLKEPIAWHETEYKEF